MANKNLTEIVVVLDESGSMGSIREDTIGGFNTMLKDQQASKDGKALLTLVTFSDNVRTVYGGRDIVEVEPLSFKNYHPMGGTALLDAIGQTIDAIETRYEDADSENIPAKVMFIIITDGEENSSKSYTKGQIEKMVKHQTKRHGFEFAFLGANLDAVKEGASIGVQNSFNFDAKRSDHVHAGYDVFNNSINSLRATGFATYDVHNTVLSEVNKKEESQI